jgi:hypothetical protein
VIDVSGEERRRSKVGKMMTHEKEHFEVVQGDTKEEKKGFILSVTTKLGQGLGNAPSLRAMTSWKDVFRCSRREWNIESI